ncbi:CHASE3 domain-containing protein [Amantichitinum ursilacus]|uniref:Oxygen sensor histidine kinase NreB n=1 Tax=Amantichitinum ursilacus TaxID=857265 RepID=A0A0N0XMH4_9NEIS|nr:CHASE3 domain-containing protein [Amantichitinum ursilacus]KPC54707.1 Oxygen sensor histidine kinase NreB [Amantichitinum ursilacus]
MKNQFVRFQTALRRIGWRVSLALTACAFGALLAIVATQNLIRIAEQQGADIGATRERILLLFRLRAQLLEAESSQRGFLVNGSTQYLAPYNDAIQGARRLIDDLAERYRNVPESVPDRNRAEIQQLSVQIGEKISEMDLSLDFGRKNDLGRAREIIATDRGLQASQQITEHINNIVAAETGALTSQRDVRRWMVVGLRVSVALGWIVVIALVIWSLRRLLAELESRTDEALALQQRQSELDSIVAERTGLLERLALEYQVDVERERSKLARDLHDELGAILTATKMDISWVQRQLGDSSPRILTKLEKTISNLDQGIQFKRRVVQELHPSLLTTFGLVAAMRSLAEDAAQRCGWQLDLTLPDESVRIDDVLGLIAYRILQETLNNATKYAQASQVSVSMLVDTEHLKLEIEDNGVGMDMTALPEGTHGLQGMRHRVIAIGGRMEIRSAPGKGVFTRALLPLNSVQRLMENNLPLHLAQQR